MSDYNTSVEYGYNLVLKLFKDRMEELSITNYKLSKLTGISRSTIGDYFSKKNEMSFKNQLKICAALEINPYWIPKELDDNQMQYLNFN